MPVTAMLPILTYGLGVFSDSPLPASTDAPGFRTPVELPVSSIFASFLNPGPTLPTVNSGQAPPPITTEAPGFRTPEPLSISSLFASFFASASPPPTAATSILVTNSLPPSQPPTQAASLLSSFNMPEPGEDPTTPPTEPTPTSRSRLRPTFNPKTLSIYDPIFTSWAPSPSTPLPTPTDIIIPPPNLDGEAPGGHWSCSGTNFTGTCNYHLETTASCHNFPPEEQKVLTSVKPGMGQYCWFFEIEDCFGHKIELRWPGTGNLRGRRWDNRIVSWNCWENENEGDG